MTLYHLSLTPFTVLTIPTHYRLPLFNIICPYSLSSVPTHCRLSLLTIVCPYSLSSAPTHYHLSLLTIICPYSLSSIPTHYRLPATHETLHTSCRSVGDSRAVAIVSPSDWPPCLPSLPKNDVISPRHAILLALIEGDSDCERSRWR